MGIMVNPGLLARAPTTLYGGVSNTAPAPSYTNTPGKLLPNSWQSPAVHNAIVNSAAAGDRNSLGILGTAVAGLGGGLRALTPLIQGAFGNTAPLQAQIARSAAPSPMLQGGVNMTSNPVVTVNTTVPAGGDRIFAPVKSNSDNFYNNQTVNPYQFPGMPNFAPISATGGAPTPSPMPAAQAIGSPFMAPPRSGGGGQPGGRVSEAQNKTAIALPGGNVMPGSGGQGAPAETPFLTGPGGTRIPLPTNRQLQGGVSSGINPMAPNLIASNPGGPQGAGQGLMPPKLPFNPNMLPPGAKMPQLGAPMTPKMGQMQPDIQAPVSPVPGGQPGVNPNTGQPEPSPYSQTVGQMAANRERYIFKLNAVAEGAIAAAHQASLIRDQYDHKEPESEKDTLRRAREVMAEMFPPPKSKFKAWHDSFIDRSAAYAKVLQMVEQAQAREASADHQKFEIADRRYAAAMSDVMEIQRQIEATGEKNIAMFIAEAKDKNATPAEMRMIYTEAVKMPIGAARDAYLETMGASLSTPNRPVSLANWRNIPQDQEAAQKAEIAGLKIEYFKATSKNNQTKKQQEVDKNALELKALPGLLAQRNTMNANNIGMQEVRKKLLDVKDMFDYELARQQVARNNAAMNGMKGSNASKLAFAAGQTVSKFSGFFKNYLDAMLPADKLRAKNLLAQAYTTPDGKSLAIDEKTGEVKVPAAVQVAMRQLSEATNALELTVAQKASDAMRQPDDELPPVVQPRRSAAPTGQPSGLQQAPPAAPVAVPPAAYKYYYGLPAAQKTIARQQFKDKYGIDPDG